MYSVCYADLLTCWPSLRKDWLTISVWSKVPYCTVVRKSAPTATISNLRTMQRTLVVQLLLIVIPWPLIKLPCDDIYFVWLILHRSSSEGGFCFSAKNHESINHVSSNWISQFSSLRCDIDQPRGHLSKQTFTILVSPTQTRKVFVVAFLAISNTVVGQLVCCVEHPCLLSLHRGVILQPCSRM